MTETIMTAFSRC